MRVVAFQNPVLHFVCGRKINHPKNDNGSILDGNNMTTSSVLEPKSQSFSQVMTLLAAYLLKHNHIYRITSLVTEVAFPPINRFAVVCQHMPRHKDEGP